MNPISRILYPKLQKIKRFFCPVHNEFQQMNSISQLPDFENMAYILVNPPAHPKLAAWGKLYECERRLEMYKWIERINDPAKAQRRIILNDSVSAFLLTFEATIQFLKDQCCHISQMQPFDDWLKRQLTYDVIVKGLRTLRHFEAHVESHQNGRNIKVAIDRSIPNRTSQISVLATWHLQQLSQTDLAKLKRHPLAIEDLKDWNALVVRKDISSLFVQGINNIHPILQSAELFL
jgi:hypothetical protein